MVPYWADRWRQLGSELKVEQSQMNIIEYKFPRDCEMCCNEMLHRWLDTNYDATWDNVITATDKLSYVPGMACNQ